jgi:hypothetical protein
MNHNFLMSGDIHPLHPILHVPDCPCGCEYEGGVRRVKPKLVDREQVTRAVWGFVSAVSWWCLYMVSGISLRVRRW